MKRVQRWDTGGTLAPAERLENGWLRCEGRTARVGILQYPGPDGSMVNELVLPEDLFDPASMASARMVPLTNNHPNGLLDSKSARAHQVGSVGENLRRDGDYLVAPIMITDGATVAAVEGGKVQLSWGYQCDVDPPDPALVGKWGPHHGIQRKRIYNHLADVDAARAGSEARVRLDASGNASLTFAPAADSVVPVVALQQSPPETPPMPQTIRIDGAVFTVDDANAPGIQAAVTASIDKARADSQAKLDAASAQLATEKARADKADGLVASLRANVTANWKRIVRKFDAMKARMMGCDGCGGSGKIDGAGGPGSAKCDYCDGMGTIRMHDAINAEPMAEEMAEDGAEGMMKAPPDESAATLAAEPAAALTAEHKDSKLGKVVFALAKKRADSIAARIRRDTAARVTLETGARKFLGADAKLDGKTDSEIKALVVGKLTPGYKLDGKSPEAVGIAYEVAITTSTGAAGNANDVRNDGSEPAPRNDGDAFDVNKAAAAYAANLKKATGPRA